MALVFAASASLAAQPAPASENPEREPEIENGTLAAAIRASGRPCAQVLEKKHEGGSRWLVRCNSGRFQVRLKEDSTAEVVAVD